MTITPEQAKTLNCNDYPRPWEIGQVPVFDAWDDYEEAWYAGPAIVYDEDIAPLVAAAPVMSEQIAGMQWEYAPQAHLNGAWKYVTGVAWKVNGDYDIRTSRTATGAIWFSDPDEVREACEELDVATYRIVRRLVSTVEETK